MDGLFDLPEKPAGPFGGFGPSEFARRTATLQALDLSTDLGRVRCQLRAACPLRPGVYGMLDPQNELIYVGVSRRLRDRLLSYFTKGPPDSKSQRIAAAAARLVWEVGSHELTSQLRELELIRRWRPRFNARGRPGRHEVGFVYQASSEAPHFRAGRRPPRTARFTWGPIPLTRRVRAAVQRLNHVFHLRDCPDRTPMRYIEQMALLPVDNQPACLRGALGTCLAPCRGDRTRQEYAQNVAAARALLDGRDHSTLPSIEAAMKEAAARHAYEQAATYRDIWQQLSILCQQLALFQQAQRDYWFVYPFTSCSGKSLWMIVAGGTVVNVLPKPRKPQAAMRCLKLLHLHLLDRRQHVSTDCEQLRLVTTWFRQHPDQWTQVVPPHLAVEYCRKRSAESCRNACEDHQ